MSSASNAIDDPRTRDGDLHPLRPLPWPSKNETGHRGPIIFVDMDEVIADFIGQVCRLFQVTPDQVDRLRPNGEWSIVPSLRQLGKVRDVRDMWDTIDSRGSDFWRTLPVLPGTDKIIQMVSAITDQWYLLSSPSHSIYSRIGKIQWIKRVFGPTFDRYLLTPHKHLLAGPGRILIDDRPDNVHTFQENGGLGILYPHPGNENRGYTATQIEWLKIQLESACPVETFHSEWMNRTPAQDACTEQIQLEAAQSRPHYDSHNQSGPNPTQ